MTTSARITARSVMAPTPRSTRVPPRMAMVGVPRQTRLKLKTLSLAFGGVPLGTVVDKLADIELKKVGIDPVQVRPDCESLDIVIRRVVTDTIAALGLG